MIRIALVGLGPAGQFHMESVLQLPGVRLAWVIDDDTEKAQRIAAEKGCSGPNRVCDALNGPNAANAVIIASATDKHFHYNYIGRVCPCPSLISCRRLTPKNLELSACMAVLAEKPISDELHKFEHAVEFAKNKNLVFVCGYQRRADPHFHELKRQLDAGAIGKLQQLRTCSRNNPIPPMEHLRAGGIFHDMLIHDFHVLDFLSNGQVPESVTTENKAMGDVEKYLVTLKYASGLIAVVDTYRDASHGYEQCIEASGKLGTMKAKNELTSTANLDPHRYLEACRPELPEFIESVQVCAPKAQKRKADLICNHARERTQELEAYRGHLLPSAAAQAVGFIARIHQPTFFMFHPSVQPESWLRWANKLPDSSVVLPPAHGLTMPETRCQAEFEVEPGSPVSPTSPNEKRAFKEALPAEWKEQSLYRREFAVLRCIQRRRSSLVELSTLEGEKG
eukprot:s2523_g7.t1